MDYDPYRYKNHYCDPVTGSHAAQCGRGKLVNVFPWPQIITCPDCIHYLTEAASELLEKHEEAVARLRELEDE